MQNAIRENIYYLDSRCMIRRYVTEAYIKPFFTAPFVENSSSIT